MMINPKSVFVGYWWYLAVILSCWNMFQVKPLPVKMLPTLSLMFIVYPGGWRVAETR